MTKPVIARWPDGSEYGYANADAVHKAYPDAVIVRYQDGTAYEPPKAKAEKQEPVREKKADG